MAHQQTIDSTVAEFVASNPATADRLLPLLHAVQQAHGRISDEAVALVAQTLNLSRADVFGVVSFYEDFRTEAPTQSVDICGAEACQALGCRSLLAEAATSLAPNVAVREVFCLGNCAVGPSARIGARVLGRATVAGIQAALDDAGGRG